MSETNNINNSTTEFYQRATKRLLAISPVKSFEVRVDVQQFEANALTASEARTILEDEQQQTISPPPPEINSVDPKVISTSGGTTVTINGSRFVNGSQLAIKFGGQTCTSVTFVSDIKLTCVSPSHSAGLVDVDVLNGDTGIKGTLRNGLRYVNAPQIISISPNSLPLSGGYATITGLNFSPSGGSAQVFLSHNGSNATGSLSPFKTTDTVLDRVLFPPALAGTYDVKVVTSDNLTVTKIGALTYVGDPPPPPSGVGGTLSAPSSNGPHNIRINTNWPFSVTSTGTAALQLKLRAPAYWGILGRPDVGLASVSISPSSVTPPGVFSVVVGTPYPSNYGDTLTCSVDFVLVDPANPSIALPTYGDARYQPTLFNVLAVYPS